MKRWQIQYSEQIRAMSEQERIRFMSCGMTGYVEIEDFPDTKYIIVDTYATGDLSNVKTVAVEPQEALSSLAS